LIKRPASEDLALVLASAAPRARVPFDEVRQLASAIKDWSSLISFAEQHAVLPLVDDALRRSGADVPSEATQQLSGRIESIALTGLHHLDLTAKVCARLGSAGLQVAPFKGPTLALMLYGSATMRSSTDIDLLVARPDALAARRALEREGFRFWVTLDAHEENRFLRYANEYTLSSPDGSIVELSWALAPRAMCLDVDMGSFLQHTMTLDTPATTFNVLGPEEYLVALSVHGSKHRWERIGWVADIAQLLDMRTMDLHRASAIARLAHVERPLRLALVLADIVTARDQAAKESVAVANGTSLSHLVEAVLHGWSTRLPSEPDPIFDTFALRLHTRAATQAEHVWRSALTPTVEDWRFVRLPERLAWVYPLVRPVRLAWKYASEQRGRTASP